MSSRSPDRNGILMVLKCGRCWCGGVPPKAVIPPRLADDQFQSHEIEWIAGSWLLT